MVIRAVIRDGVAVPKVSVQLPDGLEVDIIVPEHNDDQELLEEMRDWEAFGLESWAMIDGLEQDPTDPQVVGVA